MPFIQGAKPAAPPTTSSLVWARRRRGAARAAVAAPAAARIVRRFKALALDFVIFGSPRSTLGKQGPCLGRGATGSSTQAAEAHSKWGAANATMVHSIATSKLEIR